MGTLAPGGYGMTFPIPPSGYGFYMGIPVGFLGTSSPRHLTPTGFPGYSLGKKNNRRNKRLWEYFGNVKLENIFRGKFYFEVFWSTVTCKNIWPVL